MGFNLNDYNYGVQKVHDLMQEVWNNGYDEGMLYGRDDSFDLLKEFIVLNREFKDYDLEDIILNYIDDRYEYIDALVSELRVKKMRAEAKAKFSVGDVVQIDEDTLALVTDTTNKDLTVMTCDGQFWNVAPENVEKRGHYCELGVALDFLAEEQNDLRR